MLGAGDGVERDWRLEEGEFIARWMPCPDLFDERVVWSEILGVSNFSFDGERTGKR